MLLLLQYCRFERVWDCWSAPQHTDVLFPNARDRRQVAHLLWKVATRCRYILSIFSLVTPRLVCNGRLLTRHTFMFWKWKEIATLLVKFGGELLHLQMLFLQSRSRQCMP